MPEPRESRKILARLILQALAEDESYNGGGHVEQDGLTSQVIDGRFDMIVVANRLAELMADHGGGADDLEPTT